MIALLPTVCKISSFICNLTRITGSTTSSFLSGPDPRPDFFQQLTRVLCVTPFQTSTRNVMACKMVSSYCLGIKSPLCIPHTTFPRDLIAISHTTTSAFRIMSSCPCQFSYRFWVGQAQSLFVWVLVDASRGSLVQVGLGLDWIKGKT